MRTEPAGVLQRKASIRAFAAVSSKRSKPKRKTMDLVKTKQGELQNMLREGKGVYVGATKNPQKRAYGHARTYSGKSMYFATTDNMQYAEQKLIDACPRCDNIQRGSNVPNGKGYVYVID
ncbi:hypothetical protein BaRGS_00039779 [Batillaria attramentaria]|uniref:Uncharacterized protein n=1 Tax=Batillaria attramentaria TaxID=370345 RepID=A0ABD0J1Y7_9CAEN